jgi:hypothetical protein
MYGRPNAFSIYNLAVSGEKNANQSVVPKVNRKENCVN